MPSQWGARRPAPRTWLIVHLVTLALSGALIMYLARDQWFFFDEWDFLVPRNEWSWLAPHNGHLSLIPMAITTALKAVVGLSAYWPYLVVTVALHLALVHLLWRLSLRAGASPLISTAVALVMAVLGSGAENMLWAFQTGFLIPLVTGVAALLIALREPLTWRATTMVGALLLVGVLAAGTGIPLVAGVGAFVWARHGWRRAALAVAIPVIVYAPWFLVFGRSAQLYSRAETPYHFGVLLPEFVARGFIDGFAETVPAAALAAPLLVLLLFWAIADLARTGVRGASPVHFLAACALAFAVLTAYSRVQLGVETASSSRYVYVYVAFLVPAVAVALTALTRRSRTAEAVTGIVLLVLAVYNAGTLAEAAHREAEIEGYTREVISAAAELDDGSAPDDRVPLPMWAPLLQIGDLRELVQRGDFTPSEFAEDARVTAELSLGLSVEAGPADAPKPDACAAVPDSGFVPLETAPGGSRLVWASAPVRVSPNFTEPGQQPLWAFLDLAAGLNDVSGLPGVDLSLRSTDDAVQLCAPIDETGAQ